MNWTLRSSEEILVNLVILNRFCFLREIRLDFQYKMLGCWIWNLLYSVVYIGETIEIHVFVAKLQFVAYLRMGGATSNVLLERKSLLNQSNREPSRSIRYI